MPCREKNMTEQIENYHLFFPSEVVAGLTEDLGWYFDCRAIGLYNQCKMCQQHSAPFFPRRLSKMKVNIVQVPRTVADAYWCFGRGYPVTVHLQVLVDCITSTSLSQQNLWWGMLGVAVWQLDTCTFSIAAETAATQHTLAPYGWTEWTAFGAIRVTGRTGVGTRQACLGFSQLLHSNGHQIKGHILVGRHLTQIYYLMP